MLIASLALIVGALLDSSVAAAQESTAHVPTPQTQTTADPAVSEPPSQATVDQKVSQKERAEPQRLPFTGDTASPATQPSETALAAPPNTCAQVCPSNTRCADGRCVSACNPPCDAGATCTAEGQCIRLSAQETKDSEIPTDLRPKALPYQDGPAPIGYRLDSRASPWMWASGLGTWGSTYLGSVVMGVGQQYFHDSADWFVPLVGPFIAAVDYNLTSEGTILAIALGAGQVIGAGLIIGGLIVRRKQFIRVAKLDLNIVPTMFGTNLPGLGINGRF